jgi:ACS family tartrate transporter-like MFS transporter
MKNSAERSIDLAEETRRRVAWRLMPFIFILYIVSYLDRVNVGFAALQMRRELGLSGAVFGFGGGIFFLGYFLLEVPGGILAELWSARKWIGRIMITWGIVASLTGFIQNAQQFYWLRFLLGISEAGFVPGILVYMTHWFRPADRGRAIAMFFAAAPASTIAGGPLAAMLLKLHWLGYSGWRWLFILEGIPAFVLGFVALCYLTDSPKQAKWLRPDQRDWLAGELEKERAGQSEHVSIWRALTDFNIVLLAVILFCGLSATYAVNLWLPQMIQQVSRYGDSTVSLLAAIPSLCALPLMLWAGRHSDRSGERVFHAGIPRVIAGVALLICFFFVKNTSISIAMLSVATVGFYCAHPGFWPIPNMLLGRAAAAASIGLINSFGNLGGFFGPYILGLLSDRSGDFGGGLLYVSACSFAAGLLVFRIRTVLRPHAAAIRPNFQLSD